MPTPFCRYDVLSPVITPTERTLNQQDHWHMQREVNCDGPESWTEG
jgi:hypothetical protein